MHLPTHKQPWLWKLLGWYGALAIILAYFLNSFSLLTPQSLLYQLLNLTGAIGIIAVSYKQKAYPPMILNIFWALIAAVTLISS